MGRGKKQEGPGVSVLASVIGVRLPWGSPERTLEGGALRTAHIPLDVCGTTDSILTSLSLRTQKQHIFFLLAGLRYG